MSTYLSELKTRKVISNGKSVTVISKKLNIEKLKESTESTIVHYSEPVVASTDSAIAKASTQALVKHLTNTIEAITPSESDEIAAKDFLASVGVTPISVDDRQRAYRRPNKQKRQSEQRNRGQGRGKSRHSYDNYDY